MITTVLRVSWLGLVRDRIALSLTFVLPVVFFTIFAAVFSAMDPGGLRPVSARVVVDQQEVFAAAVARRLAAEPRLIVDTVASDRLADALAALRRGETAVVVVLPAGLRASWGGDAPAIDVHADLSNPLAAGVTEGLVQAAVAAAAVEQLALGGAGPAVRLEMIDALGRRGKRPSVAFFAAGLGVMFLMFAVTGRGSILLDERENGVLSRLLAARVGLVRLLAGRWLFLAGLGFVQVTVMFAWAAVAFGLELFTPHHLAGFSLVTAATAVAASSFGLLLSSLCRTRAQLSGVAVVVILTLCAVGGNLFPSFLMPERLQQVGSLTFNAWALEAYQKVFWYELPLADLLPQLVALVVAAGAFFVAALAVAGRWQRTGGLLS